MLIYRFVRVATYGLRHGGHFLSDVTMPSLPNAIRPIVEKRPLKVSVINAWPFKHENGHNSSSRKDVCKRFVFLYSWQHEELY